MQSGLGKKDRPMKINLGDKYKESHIGLTSNYVILVFQEECINYYISFYRGFLRKILGNDFYTTSMPWLV